MAYKSYEAQLEYSRRWRREKYRTDIVHREKRLRYNWGAYLKSKYGITPEEYEDRLRVQKRKCLICGYKTPRYPEKKQMLHLDHDHKTGKVRGFLCSLCNKGIGCLKDSPELLEKAAEYIRNAR